MPLDIIIVGGGIAGLSAALFLRANHNVTILERGSVEYDRVNDYGFSVISNAFNLLIKAGLQTDRLDMIYMTHVWQRSAQNEEIFTIDFDTRKSFGGAPSILAKRALIQTELLRLATSDELPGRPATIVENIRVSGVDVRSGVVTSTDGQTFSGDLIVGADGISSVVRTAIVESQRENGVGETAPVTATTDTTQTQKLKPYSGRTNDLMAFITKIPLSALIQNETTKDKNHFLKDPVQEGGLVNWYTPQGESDKKRVMAYHTSPTELQVLGYAPEREFAALFESKGASIIKDVDPKRALEEFTGIFDESICELFRLGSITTSSTSINDDSTTTKTGIDAWRIRDAEPLQTWRAGKTILIGDAAHAVTPHAGQGCNMSIEDAEALGYLLGERQRQRQSSPTTTTTSNPVSTSISPNDIPSILDEFVKLRRERTYHVSRFSRHMGALMSKEEENEAPVMSREEHIATTYGYLGAAHALKTSTTD